MKTSTTIVLAAALAAVLPLAIGTGALAQSADTAYCNALGSKYTQYVARGRHGVDPNVSVDTAMSKCQSDPGGSIPVLERALQGAKVDLPPRS